MRRLLLAGAIVAIGLVGLVPGVAAANDDNDNPPPTHCPPPWADPTVILGTTGNDRLVGDRCDNLIVGFAGNDVLIGHAGEDTLRGGRHDDRLRGVDGEVDQLNGGSGFDRCVGDQYDTFRRCDATYVIEV
jgi:Ca2+-binding RTX toxin-like protein